MLVRTEHLTRARREDWGDYAGGPSPGLSFTTADWLHGTKIAAVSTDTWDFEPLAADCASDGIYEFWLTTAPLTVTGAVGAPVNPIAVK